LRLQLKTETQDTMSTLGCLPITAAVTAEVAINATIDRLITTDQASVTTKTHDEFWKQQNGLNSSRY
jgi:hypothetical protein